LEELLGNPAVQAGVAPFIASLVGAIALRRTRWMGLAIAAAFFLVVALTIGYSFESLTATRKLILIGGAAFVAAGVLELTSRRPTAAVRGGLVCAASAAAVWMLWRVLEQHELGPAVGRAVGAAAYVALMIESYVRAPVESVGAAATSMLLGLAAGALALLGASALLAQFGIALGAGAGAVLLVLMLRGQPGATGWALTLAVAMIAAFLGLLAVFTGSLPWYSLLPTLAIPWAVRLVQAARHGPRVAAVLMALAGLVPLLFAAALAYWGASGTG
jgi:hypothetical protein